MTSSLRNRNFLFLQGPQSKFFSLLRKELISQGASCHKVSFCGGDVLLWGAQLSLWYRGTLYDWPHWFGETAKRLNITDICLYGDCRPMHWEAVRLAQHMGIRVWVFEEGYLRGGYSTLEENGVNGRSSLPKTPDEIYEIAAKVTEEKLPVVEETITTKVYKAIIHHVGNIFLFPFFCHYKTHRPHNIAVELMGILPRFWHKSKRVLRSTEDLERFDIKKKDYFFFPLQLNSDSQIQLYSPFTKMREAIVEVLSSFATRAPEDVRLLIRNHPLDNGLINYRSFIQSLAKEFGIERRVVFVEDGNTPDMVKNSKGVVLINSTVALIALEEGVPVFCLGQSVFNVKGLTSSSLRDDLGYFWKEPVAPNHELYMAFKKVLQKRALISGNFYCPKGMKVAVEQTCKRFLEAETKPAKENCQHSLVLVSQADFRNLLLNREDLWNPSF